MQKEIDLQVAVTKTFSSVAPNVVATYAQSQTKAYTDAQVKQSALKGILENTTDPEKRAELTAQLTQVQATLNAEQATYDQWKEGGSARVILHTATGGLLTGDVSGVLGAGSTAALAPQINEVKNSLPDELKGAFNLVVGAAIGAVTGGEAGAFTGSAIDWNNHQLHDTEIERIKKIADEFAKENNLKPEEAERRLLAQAMKNIDKEYYEKHAIYDEKADKYLNKKATFFTTAEGEKLLTFAPMSYYEDSSKFVEQQGFANARNSLKTQAVFTWDEKQSVANTKTWDTLKDGTIKGAINAPIELYNIPASWISEDFTIPPIPYDNEMEEKVATDTQAVWANYTSVVGAGLNRAKQVGIGFNQGIKGVGNKYQIVFDDASGVLYSNPIGIKIVKKNRDSPLELTGNNWKFNSKKDLDLRNTGSSYRDALNIAFERTGIPREGFIVTKWGVDKNGKSIPTEYIAPNGANVNIDIPKFNNVKSNGSLGEGPHQPHIGYQTPGKKKNRIRGHIFVDHIPATRD